MLLRSLLICGELMFTIRFQNCVVGACLVCLLSWWFKVWWCLLIVLGRRLLLWC